MNLLLQIPMAGRLIVLFLLGLVVGSLVNWGIYALAWSPRAISPWSPRHPDAPPRSWFDYLPLFGWLGLRRESGLHGAGFWARPLLIELCCGLGLAALYWWETSGGLVPPFAQKAFLAVPLMGHAQFLSHALLIALMLVATFIDFDEQSIPDSVTIPGTLLALLLAAAIPMSHLPEVFPGPPAAISNLLLTSPNPWPPGLFGWRALVAACCALALWSAALVPATATLRKGLVKGIMFYLESIRRHKTWPPYLMMLLLLISGTVGISFLGGPRWQAMLTAVTGLAFGGGLVWAVRIVGRISLQKEAMGFGDVTLMAMIGAFLGWQAALIVFFLSPVAALAIALTQWLFTGRKDIAFGPYLCLAALFVIVAWDQVWNGFAAGVFYLGWMIPVLVVCCLMLMMGMLMFWRFFEELIAGRPQDAPSEADAKTADPE